MRVNEDVEAKVQAGSKWVVGMGCKYQAQILVIEVWESRCHATIIWSSNLYLRVALVDGVGWKKIEAQT